MGKIAFLFPGQGSQTVGMGKDLYNNFETSKSVFDKADEILGRKISQICFEGPEDDLKQTSNTQPCIVTTSISALDVLKKYITPDYVAGHSLGEYCAMYCANVMDLETTLKSIQKRADLMSKVKGGSMAAVIGASEEQLTTALNSAEGYIDIANYNSPVQIVITGDNDAVLQACENLKVNGVKKVVPLAVSGAFHSKYMKEAGCEFENYVKNISLNDAKIPVITNVDAEITTKAEDFRAKMPKQIYSSVHWTQTIEKMVENGVDTFIEIGSGKVLAGLTRKIAPEVKIYNVFDKDSLMETVNQVTVKL